MEFATLLLLVLMVHPQNSKEDWRTREERTRDQSVQDLIRTYCGDKPRPSMLRIKNFDGTVREIRGEDLDAAKESDPLLQVLAMKSPPTSEYSICEDMVVKKAIDADFLSLANENRQLREALNFVCSSPDIGRSAKEACSARLHDLAPKKK